MPPLRERPDDLAPLVRILLDKRARTRKPKCTVAAEAMAILRLNIPWPGNVRELQNVIERALVLGTGTMMSRTFRRVSR